MEIVIKIKEGKKVLFEFFAEVKKQGDLGKKTGEAIDTYLSLDRTHTMLGRTIHFDKEGKGK